MSENNLTDKDIRALFEVMPFTEHEKAQDGEKGSKLYTRRAVRRGLVTETEAVALGTFFNRNR